MERVTGGMTPTAVQALCPAAASRGRTCVPAPRGPSSEGRGSPVWILCHISAGLTEPGLSGRRVSVLGAAARVLTGAPVRGTPQQSV
jgi:hypothetical protein